MKRRASTVIQASSTRRSSLRACRAGAMIMGAKAVGGCAMAIDGRAPVERRYPVQSFLFARAAPHLARAATSSKRWLCRRPIVSTTWQSPAAAHLFTCQANLHLLERVEKSEEADEAARDGKVRALVAPLRSKVLG